MNINWLSQTIALLFLLSSCNDYYHTIEDCYENRENEILSNFNNPIIKISEYPIQDFRSNYQLLLGNKSLETENITLRCIQKKAFEIFERDSLAFDKFIEEYPNILRKNTYGYPSMVTKDPFLLDHLNLDGNIILGDTLYTFDFEKIKQTNLIDGNISYISRVSDFNDSKNKASYWGIENYEKTEVLEYLSEDASLFPSYFSPSERKVRITFTTGVEYNGPFGYYVSASHLVQKWATIEVSSGGSYRGWNKHNNARIQFTFDRFIYPVAHMSFDEIRNVHLYDSDSQGHNLSCGIQTYKGMYSFNYINRWTIVNPLIKVWYNKEGKGEFFSYNPFQNP